jgi:hypothetical protein
LFLLRYIIKADISDSMPREFTDKDIEIFNKLAPEAGGKLVSREAGHQFPFILRPISHKFAESSEDFRARLERLSPEELDYLVGLALEGKEDVQSLVEEDIDELIAVVTEKVSPERAKQLKDFLGVF